MSMHTLWQWKIVEFRGVETQWARCEAKLTPFTDTHTHRYTYVHTDSKGRGWGRVRKGEGAWSSHTL